MLGGGLVCGAPLPSKDGRPRGCKGLTWARRRGRVEPGPHPSGKPLPYLENHAVRSRV